MALSFPVFFIIIAISGGLSRGASALIANAIGAKNKEEETTLSGQVFSLGVLSAIVVSIVGLSSADSLFRILGAVATTLN